MSSTRRSRRGLPPGAGGTGAGLASASSPPDAAPAGAGRMPTASAVVADLIDVALNIASGSVRRIPAFRPGEQFERVLPMDEVESRYYLRLTVTDRPGVLAKLAGILAEQGVSVSRLMQNPVSKSAAGEASIVIISHEAKESAVRQAIAAMESFDAVHGKICLLRIEEL